MSLLDVRHAPMTADRAAPAADRAAPTTPRRIAVLPRDTSSPWLRWLLLLVDVSCASACWALLLLGVGAPNDARAPALDQLGVVFVAVGTIVIVIAAQHLYRARACAWWTTEFSGLTRATAAGTAVALLCAHHVLYQWRTVTVVAAGALSLLVVAVARLAYSGWLRRKRLDGHFLRQVVLIADGAEAARLSHLLSCQPELGYRVCGLISDRRETLHAGIGWPWLGRTEDASRIVREAGVNGVIVSTAGLRAEPLNRMVRQLLDAGVHVQLSSGLAGVEAGRMRPAPVGHEPFFYVEPVGIGRTQLVLKRGFDIVVSAAVLIAVAPVMAMAALLVKLHDGGPVFHRQTRIGRDGEPFRLIKFRSMVPNAETMLAQLADLNERRGPLFKSERDPRITRVGRLLRATSIDELPQLLNVLTGTMSLVGPRPALPAEVAEFDDELKRRVAIRPGITGLWQVEARDNPEFDVYRRLDLFYVENWSLLFDVAILLATLPVVLEHAGRLLGRAFRPHEVSGPAEVVLDLPAA